MEKTLATMCAFASAEVVNNIRKKADDAVDEKHYIEGDRIDYVKFFNSLTIPELGVMIRATKINLEVADTKKKTIQKFYDYLTIAVVPDRMDDEGFESMKIKDVGRLQVKADIRCSCPADNKDDLFTWLNENNNSALITSQVNASTLKAFVKEQMKMDDGNYPSEILKIEAYSRATVVKN